MRARWMARLLVAAAGVSTLAAQPVDVEELPPALRDWVPWVLAATPATQCTSSNGVGLCLWPGRLRLWAGDAGADFPLEAGADWDANVDSLPFEPTLPPGWRLLAVPGAGSTPNA